jgi:DNA mismatch endonuclease (patch repair protein)
MAEYIFDTTPERSKLMRKIKSNNTKPELLLRKSLWALGVHYRLNVTKLPGKPDIVINKKKVAIFVDGEFWHGYNWEQKKLKIKSNKDYWLKKIEGNMKRDQANTKLLTEQGFTVIRFWEHELKKDLQSCVDKIMNYLQQPIAEIP